jgi:hypothetical protein
MPQVGIESTTPAFKREKIVHIVDRAASVIGSFHILLHENEGSPYFRVLMNKCNILIVYYNPWT